MTKTPQADPSLSLSWKRGWGPSAIWNLIRDWGGGRMQRPSPTFVPCPSPMPSLLSSCSWDHVSPSSLGKNHHGNPLSELAWGCLGSTLQICSRTPGEAKLRVPIWPPIYHGNRSIGIFSFPQSGGKGIMVPLDESVYCKLDPEAPGA